MSKFIKAFSDLDKIKTLIDDNGLLESIQVAQQAISIVELMGVVGSVRAEEESHQLPTE